MFYCESEAWFRFPPIYIYGQFLSFLAGYTDLKLLYLFFRVIPFEFYARIGFKVIFEVNPTGSDSILMHFRYYDTFQEGSLLFYKAVRWGGSAPQMTAF